MNRDLVMSDLVRQRNDAQAKARTLEEQVTTLRNALVAINQIRNQIINTQAFNWSRDMYPLVAILNEAGFERDVDNVLPPQRP